MINFEKFKLDNGLRVIFHKDTNTPIAAVNILYNVGSKDEDPNKTGFAHLFEHLMFGGSVNIPNFDKALQEAGGSNNAFTNCDYTNYYDTLPKVNIETALWLESDRMLRLAFTNKSLEVQRKVVIEEFKQNYLNQPYGDFWLLMRPLAYKVHPYRWATIGKDISHIENASMQDVKDFFYKYYAPNNAILTVAGDFELSEIKKLTEKWFSHINAGDIPDRFLKKEPDQKEQRITEVKRNVPIDSYYKAYHMCERSHKDFYAADLLSDILSNGDSSRLYQSLVKNKTVFSSLDAYITGSIETGLFVFTGKLNKGTDYKRAEKELDTEIEKIISEKVNNKELQKVKNKIESKSIFGETDVLNKAMGLSYFELLGNASMINYEVEKYNNVSSEDIQNVARRIFRKENSNIIYYKSAN